MVRKTVFVLGIIISLVIVSASFAQDAAVQDAGQAVAPAEAVSPVAVAPSGPPSDSEMQWLWAEAVTVDIEKKEILVRYQDYDTDEEKEMTIAVDDKTGFENVKSLAQIQAQDTLSIDYKVTANGKNTAKNISVEKAQDVGIEAAVQAAPATAAEKAPAATSDIIPLQAAEKAAAQAAQQ